MKMKKNNIFFYQVDRTENFSIIFTELNKRNILFSYFLVNQEHFLLVFSEKNFDPDFIYLCFNKIKELNFKKRRIRSLRGFLRYAIEIINEKDSNDFEVLETNLKNYFWQQLPNILRQNRKETLLKFLFGTLYLNNDETIESKIIDLEKRIINLEKNKNNF